MPRASVEEERLRRYGRRICVTCETSFIPKNDHQKACCRECGYKSVSLTRAQRQKDFSGSSKQVNDWPTRSLLRAAIHLWELNHR